MRCAFKTYNLVKYEKKSQVQEGLNKPLEITFSTLFQGSKEKDLTLRDIYIYIFL